MGGADGTCDEEGGMSMQTLNAKQNLLVELFVEELPPKALKKLGDAFANSLAASLQSQGLAASDAVVTPFATPRRLAAHITGVAAQAADKAVSQKLMPVTVGLDAAGNATPALLKKLQALGVDVANPAAAVSALKRAPDGKAEALFYDSQVKGATVTEGLQKALLTSTLTPPYFASMAANKVLTAPLSAMLQEAAMPVSAPPACARVSLAAASLISTATTLAPSRANSCAVARPMP